MDSVSDGLHALVAGCTGSGKSEALDRLACLHRALLQPRQGALRPLSTTRVARHSPDCGGHSPHARAHRFGSRCDDAGSWVRRYAARSNCAHCGSLTWLRGKAPTRATLPVRGPARIIVAIDEFRFLAHYPRRWRSSCGSSRAGRSLPHLIAATQRPSGPECADARQHDIRLSLRCVSAADSTGHPQISRAACCPGFLGAVLDG